MYMSNPANPHHEVPGVRMRLVQSLLVMSVACWRYGHRDVNVTHMSYKRVTQFAFIVSYQHVFHTSLILA